MPFELCTGQETFKMRDPNKVIGFLIEHAMQKTNPMFRGSLQADEVPVDFIGVGEKVVSVWVVRKELLERMVQEGLIRRMEDEKGVAAESTGASQ